MIEQSTLSDLLCRVAALWVAADPTGRATLARLGRRVVNDTSFFARLENPGASTTTTTLERFARFLHDAANWPGGVVPVEACELAHRVGVSAAPPALSAGNGTGDSPLLEPSGAGRPPSGGLGSSQKLGRPVGLAGLRPDDAGEAA